MNLDDEELELQRKLEEVRKRKAELLEYNNAHALAIRMDEEYNRLRDEQSKPIMIEDVELVNDTLHFKLSTNRTDMLTFLRTLKGYRFDYNSQDHTITPTEFTKLLEFIKHKNIYIRYKTNKNVINEWKPAPPYIVSMDKRGFLVTIAPSIINYELRRIPGVQYDAMRRQFRIAYTEAWRIVDAIGEAECAWSEEAKSYIENQIKMRGMLDEIAVREKPTKPITLGEYTLHDFQAVSVEFAEAAGNTLIAHEMGLGKTPCAIAVAERKLERGEAKKVLIVTPASIKPNWIRELFKFTKRSAYECYGEKPTPYDMAQIIAGSHTYIIINYDILSAVTKIPEKIEVINGERHKTPEQKRFLWVETMNMASIDLCIIDEVHYIKNVDSNRSNAVRELDCGQYITLSGTPLLNRPSELWPVLSLLDKEAAGSYEGFINHYTIDGKHSRNIDELREMLKPRMIRKVKKDVLKELPPINRITRDVVLSSPARRQYEFVLEGLDAVLDAQTGDMIDSKAITGILAQLMKMKQVVAADKIDYIVDLANELYEQTEGEHRKVIIFSQFVNTPAIVKMVAEKLNVSARASGLPDEAVWMSGEHDPGERQKIVDRFQNEDNIHFLVSGLKAAREGLNITAAGSVIFCDLDWTPANHHQAEARAYGRLSDLHSINSYYVVTEDTIEEVIMEILARKLNLFNAVIEGTEEVRDTSMAMELIEKLRNRKIGK